MEQVFVYFIERDKEHFNAKILVEDWHSLIDCLSKLDGTDDSVRIYRMPICRK